MIGVIGSHDRDGEWFSKNGDAGMNRECDLNEKKVKQTLKKKYVLGITGGVGSGKSTVLEILEQNYGATIIQADLVAKELMEPERESYLAIVREFGEEILAADGSIDRQKLAAVVFSDEKKRLLLNSLTHPLVEQEMDRRIRESEGLIVLEAALPKEAAFKRLCDSVWYIHVPEEIRIERLMASRGYTREKCLQIMASQLPEQEFRALADEVIENGRTKEKTEEQIAKLLKTEV